MRAARILQSRIASDKQQQNLTEKSEKSRTISKKLSIIPIDTGLRSWRATPCAFSFLVDYDRTAVDHPNGEW